MGGCYASVLNAGLESAAATETMMLEKLKARFKEWRRKREWNAELQLYHLRVAVMQDNRWMAHNPIVSELTDRYLRMLSDTWESQPQESVEQFRERIGLCPHKRSNGE